MALLRKIRPLCGAALLALLAGLAGCAVPQPRGDGLYQYVQDPAKGGWYHLYLPVDYVRNQGIHPQDSRRRWPLVMTFHGMKPYDNARPQEREWEYEADLYGYIVCAPELSTSNSFMQYPLKAEHSYVLRDRERVMSIMDHVFATTRADPKAVLATSWSCGGYLAHYFVNRFPSRFTCLATRLSNFSPELLTEDTVPAYRELPVAIFIGDGDFAACRTESEKAVAWYMARGFRLVRGKMIDDMGHRRIPQTAAAFFAEQLGIEPLHPAEAAATVAQVQMTDYTPSPEMIASLRPPTTLAKADVPGNGRPSAAPSAATAKSGPDGKSPAPVVQAPQLPARSSSYVSLNAGRNYPFGVRPQPPASAPPEPANLSDGLVYDVARPPAPPVEVAVDRGGPARRTGDSGGAGGRNGGSGATPGRTPPPTAGRSTANPGGEDSSKQGTIAGAGSADSTQSLPTPSPPQRVTIRIGGPAIGTSPYYLSYRVDLPPEELRGADFLWMDNGVWMGDEPSGVKLLESPGVHLVSVLIVTPDNREYRGTATVRVLEPGAARVNPARGS